jgi:hypothetical protein
MGPINRTTAERSGHHGSGRSDRLVALAVLLVLALPLVPVPGDSRAVMAVSFRAPGTAAPRAFHAPTTASVCAVMARALAYDDPTTGNFTRITCER